MRLSFVVTALALSASSANAAVFCVSNLSQLDTALFQVRFNEQPDEVRVVADEFVTADGYTISDDEGRGVSLTGGWNANCAIRQRGARSTLIAAPNTSLRLFDLSGFVGPDGADVNYEFSGFRLVGGSNQTGASALRVTGAGNFSGLILIENVDFDNNQSTSFSATAGAVQIDNLGGSNGRIVLRSSRFYNNRIGDTDPAQGTAAALRVRAPSQGPVFLSNNTFANNSNTGSGDAAAGIYVSTDSIGQVFISNSLFFGNSQPDLRLASTSNVVRLNNNLYQSLMGAPNAASAGNIVGANPLFVDLATGNLRLISNSPALRVGLVSPAGGLAPFDLDGFARGPQVDLGAHDLTATFVFRNGFEL